jgi:hypothetical protein
LPWPSGSEYVEAVQNPASVFRDPELRKGQTELDRLGLPRPRTGSYAVAFRMQCGVPTYAVRCFLKESSDRQDRYRLIHEFLHTANLPYTVKFEYQPSGILVGRPPSWRPILKMEWVQGELLGTYVKRNINQPSELRALASRWLEMHQRLSDAGMAHGDLQHGNVIVTAGAKLKLIDYDGLYVPALASRPSAELGHRNYQHPLRADGDWGIGLDRFSAWVIYYSLLVLSFDATLWAQLNDNDPDRLIFNRLDYEKPDDSRAFRALAASRHHQIRVIGDQIRMLLYYQASQVPVVQASSVTSLSGSGQPPSPVPDWLKDALPDMAPSSGQPDVAQPQIGTPAAADSSWIVALSEPLPTRIRFGPRIPETILFGLSLGFVLFAFLDSLGAGAGLSIVSVALNVIVWAAVFPFSRPVRMARASKRYVRQARLNAESARAGIASVDLERAQAFDALKIRLAEIQGERGKIQGNWSSGAARSRSQLVKAISDIGSARATLSDQEASGLRKLQQTVGAELTRVNRDLAALDQQRVKDETDALDAIQKKWVLQRLGSAFISNASIRNIGPERRQALASAGIRTAADMKRRGLHGIPGIGELLQQSLLQWANRLETRAMHSRPTTLPQADIDVIRATYDQKRTSLLVRQGSLQNQLVDEQSRIASSRQQGLDRLKVEEEQVRAKFDAEVAPIRELYEARIAENDKAVELERQVHSTRLEQIDVARGGRIRELSRAGLQLARAEHHHGAFEGVTFPAYVTRVVWPFAR